MRPLFAAIAVTLIFAGPVWADSPARAKSKSAQHKAPSSKSLSNALGGWNRGDPADPYWEPCLSYYRGWGPGACGR